ncbi:MAG TPA: tetratricopeptide repeat protein [Terriglobales bacterium]|jgi:tetratricopeptide (TPR) repeat protein|nr:tetratricopeptide repeat protein [Terriglobales bacterium]
MTRSTRITLVLPLVFAFCCTTAAQRPSGGGGGGTPSGGTRTNTPGSTTTLPQPSTGFPNTQTERQILYISGSVVLQDGTAPPEPVAIEKVCGGSAHKEGYTDSKGHYQIQLGQNFELQDVSESGGSGGFGMGSRSVTGNPGSGLGGVNPRELIGCELRAMLPGFQSSTVMIRVEGSFGEIRMDTITMQRLGGGSGTTISLTTMQAPNNAKKAYERAQKAISKENFKDAEKELDKAVLEFPKFAAAWALLGMIHQSSKQLDQATKDYSQAIASDPQYAKPYFGLAVIAANQQNWKDTIRFTDQVNRLAPLAYPEAYFFSGVASFNLGKMDDAERNIRKFLSLDNEHRRPMAVLYLGDILARKQDFAGAVQQAKAYLAIAPNAPNSPSIREKLKQLEELNNTPPKQ